MATVSFIFVAVALLALWAAVWLPLLCCRSRKRDVREVP